MVALKHTNNRLLFGAEKHAKKEDEEGMFSWGVTYSMIEGSEGLETLQVKKWRERISNESCSEKKWMVTMMDKKKIKRKIPWLKPLSIKTIN